MSPIDIKNGLEVRTSPCTEHEKAMTISQKNLSVRKKTTGIVLGPVAGHGGDVWWVRHNDKPTDIGAYVCTEMWPA